MRAQCVFAGVMPFGAAVVENGVIEGAGPHRRVEIRDRLFQRGRIELELARELGHGRARDRRKQRRHEARHHAGVEDDVGDLAGLRRDQPAPDCIALRPDVLALVIEALRIPVDDDAEHHRVMARDDAAVEFRRARVDRHRMALRGIADFLHALAEQHFQDRSAVIGRAADQEIVGGLAPILLQPFDIGLEAAGGGDQCRGLRDLIRAIVLERCRQEHAVGDIEIAHLGVIEDVDPESLCRAIERIQHGAAAAQEERVGAPEAERAAERGLPAHALLDDPVQDILGLVDHHARQLLVGLAAGDAQQIFPELLLGVGTRENLGRRVVGAAHVAGVAGVAAAVEFRRAFQHQHGRAGAPGADRRAQGGVAAADHQHVVFAVKIDHAVFAAAFAVPTPRPLRGSRWSCRRDRQSARR